MYIKITKDADDGMQDTIAYLFVDGTTCEPVEKYNLPEHYQETLVSYGNDVNIYKLEVF